MPPTPPIDVSIVPGIGNIRIPENAMIQATFERIQNFGGSPEIHIRHPHGQLVFGDFPFYRIAISSIDYGVEIVHIAGFA